MLILLLFAFLSGLVTIFAPCIWPLLPIILSATTSGGRRKPLGITLGIITSFALFTLTLSYLIKIIPFDPDILRFFAVIVISFLGLSLVIPKLTQILEGFVSRLSSKFAPTQQQDPNQPPKTGFWSGLITGFSLGLVWSPCAGPILATIATLAATTSVNWQIILVTLVYVAGVGIPLFIFATIGSTIFTRSRLLSPYTARIQQFFGIIMILTAIAIFTGYDRVLQAQLLDAIPAYSDFLFRLEGNPAVQSELKKLKVGEKEDMPKNTIFSPTEPMGGDKTSDSKLPNYGLAPEFVGIINWLNTEPLTMANLKGKVVLIDFWTYTCINCIRTLPFVTSWYEKYKDQGLVVVGVHTPEFEFEKKTTNVENAITQYKITYPVAQDNNYLTWKAYDNHFWPAKYLIDHQGNVRYIHFGEGKYEETEQAIQILLSEAGQTVDTSLTSLPDETPKSRLTPETYLGLARLERFLSPQSPTTGFQIYSYPTDLKANYWALSGSWNIQNEYAESEKGSMLEINFNAKKVFLVIAPDSVEGSIKVYLDGEVVNETNQGQDVSNGFAKITEPKLYELVNLPNQENHQLKLEFQTKSTKIYAFTFGD
ncbi:cytochrome c biogenesis protein DipZ [Candidatus Daviesbacteria bacterium]|nr:cytochrome c biogenesis protein DipZ [Candidatus Daviesbacteria bacterium]